jgi:polar amino acid transport system substrate-binding protein
MKSGRHGRIALAILAAICALAVAACGSSKSSSSTSSAGGGGSDALAKFQKSGEVRVGFANEAPYAYADSSGKLAGAGAKLSDAVFKAMGIRAQVPVLTEFASLIPGMNANRFDAVVALPFITPERCQQVIYSAPVVASLESLAVKSGNPKGLNNYKDLASKGAKLGVLAGAAEGDQAKQQGVKNISEYPDQLAAVQALAAGRVDAVSLTTASLKYGVQNSGIKGVEVTPGFAPPGQVGVGGYAFRKSDVTLRDAFNKKLVAMLRNGQAAKAMAPYFGQPDIDAASKFTTAQLCAGK